MSFEKTNYFKVLKQWILSVRRRHFKQSYFPLFALDLQKCMSTNVMTAQFDFLIRNYNFPLCHIDYIRTVVFSILLLWILSKKSSRKTLDYDLKTLSFNLGLHHYLAYVWLWNLSNNVIFSKLIFLSSTEDSVKKSANICSILA